MTKGKTMDIKAVKFRKDGFYSQPFVFGGEEGAEKFDKNIPQIRKPVVSMCAPSAATSMTLQNTMAWLSRTCPMTGVVHVASNRRQSSTEHKAPVYGGFEEE